VAVAVAAAVAAAVAVATVLLAAAQPRLLLQVLLR